jgi:hypothetical protein
MPKFQNKEEYEKWKAERLKNRESEPSAPPITSDKAVAKINIKSSVPQISPNKAVVNFNFESPRLFEIIQESIQIINQTKKPGTAMRRFDDITRNIKRLFDILPPGNTIEIEINGRNIKSVGDLCIIDEEKAEWIEEHKTSGPVHDVLPSFHEAEFDKWVEIFKINGWPDYWAKVSDYCYAKEEATIEELIEQLNKADILKLAEERGIKIKKSARKVKMLSQLKPAMTDKDCTKVFDILYPEGGNTFHRIKSDLLAHHAFMKASFEELKRTHPGSVIEIWPAPDCCGYCENFRSRKIKVDTLTQDQLPPFYPGCRCSYVPALD